MYSSAYSLTLLALAIGNLATPTPQNYWNLQGWNGLSITNLQCSDPSQGTGSTTISKIDLDNWIFQLDNDTTFCVHGLGKPDVQSEWAIVQGCGANGAAVWLQSYETENFCLTGRQIKVYAELVSSGCVDISNGQVYGSAQIENLQHWVKVGRSDPCTLTSSDQN